MKNSIEIKEQEVKDVKLKIKRLKVLMPLLRYSGGYIDYDNVHYWEEKKYKEVVSALEYNKNDLENESFRKRDYIKEAKQLSIDNSNKKSEIIKLEKQLNEKIVLLDNKTKQSISAIAKKQKKLDNNIRLFKLIEDKPKLLSFSKDLLDFNLPELQTNEGKDVLTKAENLLIDVSNFIINELK